jgi:hypothetical protein
MPSRHVRTCLHHFSSTSFDNYFPTSTLVRSTSRNLYPSTHCISPVVKPSEEPNVQLFYLTPLSRVTKHLRRIFYSSLSTRRTMLNSEMATSTEEPFLQPFDLSDAHEWEIEETLCELCRSIAADAISGWKSREANWVEHHRDPYNAYSTVYDDFLILPPNQNRVVGLPSTSIRGRCPLCTLVAHELRHLPEGTQYTIRVRPVIHGSFFISLVDRHENLSSSILSDETIACVSFFKGIWPPVYSSLGPNNSNAFDDIRYIWPVESDEYNGQTSAALEKLEIIRPDRLEPPEYHVLAYNMGKECTRNHKCWIDHSQHGLPKRVLDVSLSDDKVFLYLSQNEALHYATLSYCWGASLPLRTLKSNFDDHCKGISLEAFPQTLKDGIKVAKTLSLKYLWIDALCR